MGIPDTIRSLIAGPVVAVFGPMRTPIQVVRVTGRDTYGPTYGDPEDDEALVENISESVAGTDGVETVSGAKFTFFKQRAIAEEDQIILNGVTLTVIKVGGLLDETGVPYLPEAWTGKG